VGLVRSLQLRAFQNCLSGEWKDGSSLASRDRSLTANLALGNGRRARRSAIHSFVLSVAPYPIDHFKKMLTMYTTFTEMAASLAT
jgi:hypothetical protein